MAAINNIDGIVHSIADTPRGEGQSKSIRLERSGPTASPSSPAHPRENRPINELLERLGTAQTETNQRLNRKGGRLGNLEGNAYERKIRAGSCLSPQPGLNSNPPPDRAPERPRNSTAISTDQRRRKYCEDRSRPPRVTQAPQPPAVDPC